METCFLMYSSCHQPRLASWNAQLGITDLTYFNVQCIQKLGCDAHRATGSVIKLVPAFCIGGASNSHLIYVNAIAITHWLYCEAQRGIDICNFESGSENAWRKYFNIFKHLTAPSSTFCLTVKVMGFSVWARIAVLWHPKRRSGQKPLVRDTAMPYLFSLYSNVFWRSPICHQIVNRCKTLHCDMNSRWLFYNPWLTVQIYDGGRWCNHHRHLFCITFP